MENLESVLWIPAVIFTGGVITAIVKEYVGAVKARREFEESQKSLTKVREAYVKEVNHLGQAINHLSQIIKSSKQMYS